MKRTLILIFSTMIFAAGGFHLSPANDSTPVPAKAGKEVKADSAANKAISSRTDSSTAIPITDHKLVVYYFHGNQRCSNCLKIEAYTKEAIDSAFADPIKDSLMFWRVINTDEDANKHYRDNYQLYTKSVILSDLHNGKEVRWKNLEKVWKHLGDKVAFKNYIRDEVTAYLKVH